ncbi:MAG: hypothetical protein D6B26_03480 [Spirochaetaceae bacterium]|nr:MAG: hypothetical protein D6B26_03480 [Spirochaetaceae bacterium]
MSEPQEVLLAIRMRWLIWLSKPIKLLWYVIVEAAMALWRLLRISAQGVRGSYNADLLKKSSMGTAAVFLVLFLSAYCAALFELVMLVPIGIALAVIPAAWTLGEVTAVAGGIIPAGTKPAKNAKNSNEIPTGVGNKVALTMALYVGIILLAIVIQAALALLPAVPKAGPLFLGIVLIPNVFLSAIALVAMLLLSYSMLVLPSYFVVDKKKAEKFGLAYIKSLNVELLGILKGNSFWIQALIIAPVALVFSLVAALPMILLVGASFALAMIVQGGVTAFSETAGQSMAALSQVIGNSLESLSSFPVMVQIGMVLVLLALSLLCGAGISPLVGCFASIYHNLYKQRMEGKGWTFIVLLVVLAIAGFFVWGALLALGTMLAGLLQSLM